MPSCLLLQRLWITTCVRPASSYLFTLLLLPLLQSHPSLCSCAAVFLWVLLCMGDTWTRNERKDCLCYTLYKQRRGIPFGLHAGIMESWHGTRCNRNRIRNGEREGRRKKAFHGQKCTADKFPFADYFILLFWHKVIIPEAKYYTITRQQWNMDKMYHKSYLN